MTWDMAIKGVRDELPQFNKYLLIDYRKEQVQNAMEYMGDIFQHAIKPLRSKIDIEYIGYRVASPEETIEYLLNSNAHVKNTINIQHTEAVLVNYEFRFMGNVMRVPIYIPYLQNNMIVNGNICYILQHVIVQKIVVRINSGKGVMVKVLQTPARVFRNDPVAYKDTDGKEYSDSIISAKIYYKKDEKTKRDSIPTVLLYLLAQFGFNEAMRKMCAEEYILGFVDHLPKNPDGYTYFQLTKYIYLKVAPGTMESQDYRRIVLSMIYIWQKYQDESNPLIAYDKSQYRMILGQCIQPDQPPSLFESHGESHLESMQDYLDDITKNNLYKELNIKCNDIYDLLVFLFFRIDLFLTNYRPNDLFDKKLRGSDALFDEVITTLFKMYVYRIKRNVKRKDNKAAAAFKLPSNIIMKNIYTVEGASSKSSFNNDNAFFSILVKKLRPDQSREQGSKTKGKNRSKNSKSNTCLMYSEEHNLHPSFAAVESVWSLPSGNPGIGGDINPFLVIDNKGVPQKDQMPWYSEIEDLVDKL